MFNIFLFRTNLGMVGIWIFKARPTKFWVGFTEKAKKYGNKYFLSKFNNWKLILETKIFYFEKFKISGHNSIQTQGLAGPFIFLKILLTRPIKRINRNITLIIRLLFRQIFISSSGPSSIMYSHIHECVKLITFHRNRSHLLFFS